MTKTPGIPDALPPGTAPIDVIGMAGVRAWFSFSAARQASEATGIAVGGDLLGALLRGDMRAIEECVPRGLINPDGSRWSGGVDAVPLPTLDLGRLLADALHRRLLGKPLDLDEGE